MKTNNKISGENSQARIGLKNFIIILHLICLFEYGVPNL